MNTKNTNFPQPQSLRRKAVPLPLRLKSRLIYGNSRRSKTGKELDRETGLYYYGARYLDPKTSRWLSGDPALGEYIPSAPVNDEAKKRNGNLPGQGGVFNLVNLHVYHYAGNNPVVYIDPNGNFLVKQFIFASLQTVGGIIEVVGGLAGAAPSAGVSTFAVIHGIGNVGDGLIGMITAATDNEWGGAIFETTKAVLSNTTDLDTKTVDAISNGVAAVEGIATMKITSGVSLGKTIDRVSDLSSAAGITNSVLNASVPLVNNGESLPNNSSSEQQLIQYEPANAD